MPILTTVRITNQPVTHRLTLNASAGFPVLIYYQMRGAGGGAGGGVDSGSTFRTGANGQHGSYVAGQIIINPGDSLYLSPGEAGHAGKHNITSNAYSGKGGLGVRYIYESEVRNFSGGNGGAGGSSGVSGTGGGGGGASVIAINRNSGVNQIVAVAAGGGGGGGAGVNDSATNSGYITSLWNYDGGGPGQTHGDSTTYNYRNGSYLGNSGGGAGGGGGGYPCGRGGVIDFQDRSGTGGSAGDSFSSLVVDRYTITTNKNNISTSSPIGLEDQLGGDGGVASLNSSYESTSGEHGYIVFQMYTLHKVKYKDPLRGWILPSALYYKITPDRWTNARRAYIKENGRWNKVFDIEAVDYNLYSHNIEAYTYSASTQSPIAKEGPPPPPPPVEVVVRKGSTGGDPGGDGGGGGGGGGACPSGANPDTSDTTCSVDSGGDGGGGGDKIICTAMNRAYGFGSYRNNIWLMYSSRHMSKAHEVGYHTLFLPLVNYAFYYENDSIDKKIIRTILEHGTRHRTADLRAEMRNTKRDFLGRVYRLIFEPLCYIVGKMKGY